MVQNTGHGNQGDVAAKRLRRRSGPTGWVGGEHRFPMRKPDSGCESAGFTARFAREEKGAHFNADFRVVDSYLI